MDRRLILAILLFFSARTLLAQFNDYTEQWSIFLTTETSYSGSGVSVFDFNDDGMDDLTIPEHNSGIALYQFNGTGFTLVYYIAHAADIKHILWVDLDNDEDRDLFYTTNDQGIFLYENLGGLNLVAAENAFPVGSEVFAYGASFGDYDRDGLLDVFVGAYNYFGETYMPNMLFHNDGNLQFSNVANEMGVEVATGVAFQPVWTDINNDLWPDLYLINDHGIENEFYINQQGSYFLNFAQESQSNIAMNSMTNSISDYDQDGDFDIFITDSYYPALLNNENFEFTNVAEEAGVSVLSNDWAGLWIDANLDGYEDLQVCTQNTWQSNRFYLNNLDGTFDLFFEEPSGFESYASASGDFENDLKPDYIVMHGNPYGYHLYNNKSVLTNSFKVNLKGTISNKDGIGTKIKYFINGQQFLQEQRAGENYLGQNAHRKILGCAQSSVVDSIHIEWPSGFTDRFYNLVTNEIYTFTEGQTFNLLEQEFIQALLCEGDTITLTLPDNFEHVNWSDGYVGPSRPAYESGEYVCTFSDNLILFDTLVYSVQQIVKPTIGVTHPVCYGDETGSIVIESPDDLELSVSWTDGSIAHLRDSLSAGAYYFTMILENECQWSDSVFLFDPDAIAVSIEVDTICTDETVNVDLLISGGSAPYIIETGGLDIAAVPAGLHSVLILDSMGCVNNFAFEIFHHETPNLNLIQDHVCAGDSIFPEFFSDNDVEISDWTITNATSQFLSPGTYEIQINDDRGCTSYDQFEIYEYPEMTVQSSSTMQTGANDGTIQIIVENGIPPYSFLWNNGETLPELFNLPEGIYSCTIEDAVGCITEISILLSSVDGQQHPHAMGCFMHPSGSLQIVNNLYLLDIRLFDALGKEIRTIAPNSPDFSVDLADLPRGLHIVNIGNRQFKFVH
jgi:hypothetical protein